MNFDARKTGTRIKAIRKDRNITVVKAANDLHLSEGAYRKIETGERGFSVDVLIHISDYFCVSTDYLLKGYGSNPAVSEELSAIIRKLQRLQDII